MLQDIVKKFKGSFQKVRRAQVLLKADADGPAWADAKVSEAFGCRIKTVENIRHKIVTEGFEIALNGKKQVKPTREKVFDGNKTSIR